MIFALLSHKISLMLFCIQILRWISSALVFWEREAFCSLQIRCSTQLLVLYHYSIKIAILFHLEEPRKKYYSKRNIQENEHF